MTIKDPVAWIPQPPCQRRYSSQTLQSCSEREAAPRKEQGQTWRRNSKLKFKSGFFYSSTPLKCKVEGLLFGTTTFGSSSWSLCWWLCRWSFGWSWLVFLLLRITWTWHTFLFIVIIIIIRILNGIMIRINRIILFKTLFLFRFGLLGTSSTFGFWFCWFCFGFLTITSMTLWGFTFISRGFWRSKPGRKSSTISLSCEILFVSQESKSFKKHHWSEFVWFRKADITIKTAVKIDCLNLEPRFRPDPA